MKDSVTTARERPILFSGEMVRAILDGRKTQTRRVVKKNASGRAALGGKNWHLGDPDAVLACPYGQPGDRLWVKETWRPWNDVDLWDVVQYRADMSIRKPDGLSENDGFRFNAECEATIQDQIDGNKSPWKPSIFMPHWASRLTLEIVRVRVERLQEIGEEDAMAEGMPNNHATHWPDDDPGYIDDVYRRNYAHIWNTLNAKRGFGWDANPWVWVIDFKRVTDV